MVNEQRRVRREKGEEVGGLGKGEGKEDAGFESACLVPRGRSMAILN